MKKLNIKIVLLNIFISLAILVALGAICSTKGSYHVDEIYTYRLSNSVYTDDFKITSTVKTGVVYTGAELIQSFLTANEGNTFNYSNVVKLNSTDVHPPLYYMLVHTVSSFFPGTFSLWYALSINLILAVIIFWQIWWIFNHMTKSKAAAYVFALIWVATTASVSSTAFLRMYALLAMWTNALVILFLKNKNMEKSVKYYISLFCIMFLGTMTQYFFVVFAFFACAIYAIYCLSVKNWKRVVASIALIGGSFLLAIKLYPAMISQVLSSNRGLGAMSESAEGFSLEYLKQYANILNTKVFGNFLWYILGAALVLLVINAIVKSKVEDGAPLEKRSCQWMEYMMLIVPAAMNVIIVSQIAPYRADRYIMNTMGITFAGVYIILYNLAKKRGKIFICACAVLALVTTVSSYKYGISYFYDDAEEVAAAIAEINDAPCLYIYGRSMYILPNYVDLADFNEIRFIKKKKFKKVDWSQYCDYDQLVLYL